MKNASAIVIIARDAAQIEAEARRRGMRVLGSGRSIGDIDAATLDAADALVADAEAIEELRADDEVYERVPALRIADTGRDPFCEPIPMWGRTLKRAVDLAISLPAVLVSAPLVLVLCALVRLDSAGPAFFHQERVGKDGRRFMMLKLRTMRQDNDSARHREFVARQIDGHPEASAPGLFKLVDDDRITRLGRYLRKLSLDELPQLVNVLRGEMSVVGPRPPLPSEAARFDARMWKRQRVKPGITGLWQVSGRARTTWQEMIDLDLDYIDGWAIRRELGILLRTPAAVMARDTA